MDVHVPLPPEHAIELFTPVGERAWAAGWDPVFPAGERGDGSAVGTVFLTHGTTWVVVDREPDRVRYARVAPGAHAGTVEVRVRPGPDGGSVADVTYDLTTIAGEAFHPDVADWEEAIAAALPGS